MIEEAFAIYPHDSPHDPFILRRMKDGKMAVMDEYETLVCKKCRKVNERAAFAQGIQKEVVVRSKRPFLRSLDDFYLLDKRAMQIFSALFPEEIEYFRLPSVAFWVASARVWLQPEESNPGVRFVRSRCSACGRPGEVVWGREPFVVAVRKPLYAVNLEGIIGARESWVISREAAAKLGAISPPLKGMELSPIQINVVAPV